MPMMTRVPCPSDTSTSKMGSGLVVVDAPNVDAVAARMFGHSPRREERFDPAALAQWANEYVGSPVELTLFTNVAQPAAPGVEGWVKSLVDCGWRVYARPKIEPNDDVDAAMVEHLMSRPWDVAIVFSHDARCFVHPLSQLANRGSKAVVVGFRQCAGRLPYTDGVTFVDAQEVPNLYRVTPSRVLLDDLPRAGSWLEPSVN